MMGSMFCKTRRPGNKPQHTCTMVILGRDQAEKRTIAHRILTEDNPEEVQEGEDKNLGTITWSSSRGIIHMPLSVDAEQYYSNAPWMSLCEIADLLIYVFDCSLDDYTEDRDSVNELLGNRSVRQHQLSIIICADKPERASVVLKQGEDLKTAITEKLNLINTRHSKIPIVECDDTMNVILPQTIDQFRKRRPSSE